MLSEDGSVTRQIGRLKSGDQAAAVPLWRRYFQRLVRIASKRLTAGGRRASDEEDVALTAFASFCRQAEGGRLPKVRNRDDLWRLLVTLTIRRLLGPRPLAYGIRAAIITLMLAFALASGFGISPRVEAMQREIGGPVAALPESDPRRSSFYQLHGLSNLLLSATAIGALLLAFWESREHS